jgi:CheY-like chemotaxis protein
MPKKCLVVDDNPETVDIVCTILKKAGYLVLEAYDGEKGLAAAQATLPDLILLDIMMPVMDGLAMNQRLKEDPKTRDIPVIIMTARSGMEPMFQGPKSSTIQAYLVKPFSQKELLKRISEILGNSCR